MATTKSEWVAIGISGLAVVLTLVGNFVQQGQLTLAKQEWESTHGNITATAHVSTYDEKWTKISPGTNIPETDLLAPVQLYAIVDVVSSGASATAIGEVGIWKDQSERLASEARCPPSSVEVAKIEKCQFPVRIPEFGKTTFYIPLTSHLKTEMQCNDYIRDNGINIYVERIDGTVATAETDTTVGISAYCPVFNPPEQ